jgi:hypothetical protein
MRHLPAILLAVGSFVLGGCLHTDDRIVSLSDSQLTYYCRLEAKLGLMHGKDVRGKDEYKEDCGERARDVAESTGLPAMQVNFARNAENRAKVAIGWEYELMRRRAVARAGDEALASVETIRLATEEATARKAVAESVAGQADATRSALKTLADASGELRRNQANLHECLDLDWKGALAQALRFNFKPIKDQCLLDVETLKSHITALREVRERLGD